ncbi:LuxR C-terminal-related transcriptional regulator [Aquabacterium humicola]|uniref:LuxR C-terminal-related transcriptional regulator n=1 Tax=Aquabacterium humicola TaxID=3237377 RepID=UPI002542EA7D|nr:response regulator transcription factor [Rubrivivax pictus]
MLKHDPLVRFPPAHVLLVVDESALVREGVRRIVEGLVGPVCCLEAGDGDALAQALQRTPAVSLVVLDPRVPGMAGGARLVQLAEQHPSLRFVVICDLTPHEAGVLMARVPAVMACLPRLAPLSRLRAGIEAAFAGRTLDPAHARGVRPRGAEVLTARQAEVLALLREGLSNKVIAVRLGIGEGTVKNHVSALLRVLKVKNRTQAARQRDGR